MRTGAPRSSAACASAISLRSRMSSSLWSCGSQLIDRDALPARPAWWNSLREVEALRLPVLDHLALVEHLHLADHLVEGAVAQRRHQLAHLLGDEEEEVDDVLGLAGEALAQHRVLRRDADRAGVEMALAHHDAAGGDQRRGGEAELVGAEQRADHDVAAGADAAVDLHRDAAAQPVGTSVWWVSARPISHGRAGVLERGERARRRCRPRSRRW